MVRQTSVLQFDSNEKSLSETVAMITGTMVPLDSDSFLFDQLEGGKMRLKVFREGSGSRDLLESSEESSGPAAKVGAASVAFLAGARGVQRIAIATLREGRIVKRFPFDASSVKAIAATPDGARLYYCDGGKVWQVGIGDNSATKPVSVTTGASVAIDGAGKYLYIKRTDRGIPELVRMPLAGGQAERLTIPSEYVITDDPLSPAAVDAGGRILFEVDSPDSWYEHVAILDPAKKTFAVVKMGFSGDVWLPAWESDGRIAAVGARLDCTLWRYRPSRSAGR